MMRKLSFAIGAFFGCTGVMLGAFGAHALRNMLSVEKLNSFMTAVDYQLVHALALLFLFLLKPDSQTTQKLANIVFSFWSLGTLFFSGSIYFLVLTGIKSLWFVTPFGGLLLIAGWASAFLCAFKMQKKSTS